MAIRLPLKQVLDQDTSVENGAGVAVGNASLAGVAAYEFTIPQDADNIVVKFTASIKGAGASVTLQTSDDGATTWYDVARTSIISNAVAENAQWLSSPVIGVGARSGDLPGTISSGGGANAGSIFGAIGTAASSSIGMLTVTGLPILGQQGRVAVIYSAGITSIINERIKVLVNSQDQ